MASAPGSPKMFKTPGGCRGGAAPSPCHPSQKFGVLTIETADFLKKSRLLHKFLTQASKAPWGATPRGSHKSRMHITSDMVEISRCRRATASEALFLNTCSVKLELSQGAVLVHCGLLSTAPKKLKITTQTFADFWLRPWKGGKLKVGSTFGTVRDLAIEIGALSRSVSISNATYEKFGCNGRFS